MSFNSLYQQKRMKAADAIRQVNNGDTIVVPTGAGEPPTLLTALSEQRRDFRDVQVAQILPLRKYGYFDPETAEHVRHVAYFFGGASRAGGQAGLDRFRPRLFFGTAHAHRPGATARRRGVLHGVPRWTSTATFR